MQPERVRSACASFLPPGCRDGPFDTVLELGGKHLDVAIVEHLQVSAGNRLVLDLSRTPLPPAQQRVVENRRRPLETLRRLEQQQLAVVGRIWHVVPLRDREGRPYAFQRRLRQCIDALDVGCLVNGKSELEEDSAADVEESVAEV